MRQVLNDPARLEYTDLAITPPVSDEIEDLEMFQTASGHDYVEKLKKIQSHRGAVV
jgi:hypothetical protein